MGAEAGKQNREKIASVVSSIYLYEGINSTFALETVAVGDFSSVSSLF